MGLAGSWAAGAVLVDGDEPARFDQVTTGRAAIFTGGQPVRLPDHRDGWRWEPYAVDGTDIEAARQQLQRLMRDAEADIAEALSNGGWLTVLDGPLHGIRHRRGLPVIGYVKTHHRRMLAREHWVRVPELTAGERSGLFAMKDALYGCYLRVGDPRSWAGPWAGIARLEMPSGIARDAAVEAADQAAGWLPGFASALHRDARAPVNLTPIAGLERHLHRLQGDARLALRAVREAVLERNREGGLDRSVGDSRPLRAATAGAPPLRGRPGNGLQNRRDDKYGPREYRSPGGTWRVVRTPPGTPGRAGRFTNAALAAGIITPPSSAGGMRWSSWTPRPRRRETRTSRQRPPGGASPPESLPRPAFPPRPPRRVRRDQPPRPPWARSPRATSGAWRGGPGRGVVAALPAPRRRV